jgi:hypothetical protein
MASTFTVAQLRNLVAQITDIDIGPSERFTDESVTLMLQESYAQYWALLTDNGNPQRVTRASLTTTSDTTETLGWPENEYVTLPTDFFALLSARIELSGGTFAVMGQFSEIEGDADYDMRPVVFENKGVPKRVRVAESTDGAKILRISPPADGEYTIVVTYVPDPPALDTDDDELTFLPGTLDWVVCDVCLRMLEQDADVGSQANALMTRKNNAEAIMRRVAGRQNRAAPLQWGSVR